MKIAIAISRVLLGLGFFIFGLNILHPFLNAPPPPEGSLAAQFVAVMGPSHWMALIGLVQLVGGLLVLAGGSQQRVEFSPALERRLLDTMAQMRVPLTGLEAALRERIVALTPTAPAAQATPS